MTQAFALIVDDEPDIRELLDLTLRRMGIRTQTAADISEAKRQLDQQRFDLCLTDMRLPDGDGIDLVRYIAQRSPQLPVAMITAHGNMETAIEALKCGAFDFVSKPVDLKVLRRLVETALKLGSASPNRPTSAMAQPQQLLGKSTAMDKIRRLIEKLARSQAPVYISGESGTGKELAARLIHNLGPRREREFVAVNCGAIPQELMESELFGHRKGSFTGAVDDKEGLFQAANGGTLFLDEVGELPLPLQVKLLRVIQEKSVRPVGEQKEVPVDARIISATHRDLASLVENGGFRQDLYYRINVIQLAMPSLRERADDIPLLTEHFLEQIARQSGQPKPRIEASAMQALTRHPFVGNVRELENTLERAMALCEDKVIRAEDLHLPKTNILPEEIAADLPLEDMLGDIERNAILEALEETRWNRTAAARKLGISFRALRYRLNKLGID